MRDRQEFMEMCIMGSMHRFKKMHQSNYLSIPLHDIFEVFSQYNLSVSIHLKQFRVNSPLCTSILSNCYSLIQKADRYPHLLAHFPKPCNSQDLARPQSGAWNPSCLAVRQKLEAHEQKADIRVEMRRRFP